MRARQLILCVWVWVSVCLHSEASPLCVQSARWFDLWCFSITKWTSVDQYVLYQVSRWYYINEFFVRTCRRVRVLWIKGADPLENAACGTRILRIDPPLLGRLTEGVWCLKEKPLMTSDTSLTMCQRIRTCFKTTNYFRLEKLLRYLVAGLQVTSTAQDGNRCILDILGSLLLSMRKWKHAVHLSYTVYGPDRVKG